MFPRVDAAEVPFLTTAQMIEVDRAMIEDYGIQLIQMMENAGRNLAELARRRFLSGDPEGKRIAVLAGVGGNGGGALVSARRLQNWGANVEVFTTKPEAGFSDVPQHQLRVAARMNIPRRVESPSHDAPYDLVIDGIIGYSLQGAPRGSAADLIRWATEQPAPVLSLDTPSGLDTTNGTASEVTVRAAATMTLALPKVGLRSEAARVHVGELYLADISVPPDLYSSPRIGVDMGPLFADADIVRIVGLGAD